MRTGRIHRRCSKVPHGKRGQAQGLKPYGVKTIYPPPQGHRRPEFSSKTGVWSEERGAPANAPEVQSS